MITKLKWRQAKPPLKLRWRGPDGATRFATPSPGATARAAFIGPRGRKGDDGPDGPPGATGQNGADLDGYDPGDFTLIFDNHLV